MESELLIQDLRLDEIEPAKRRGGHLLISWYYFQKAFNVISRTFFSSFR